MTMPESDPDLTPHPANLVGHIVPNVMCDEEHYAYREFKLATIAMVNAKAAHDAAAERLRAAMQAMADAAVKP